MVPMSKLLADAKRGGYAVCYCEAWSFESFQAVVEAAEEERSPIIAGFNGGFLMHPGRKRAENLSFYAGLGLSLEKARVPAALLLNELKSLDQIEEAIDLGFNAVMVENEGFALDEYRHLVKKVVAKAHRSGVSVEAQVGHLADASSNGRAEPTSPAPARAFVEETGRSTPWASPWATSLLVTRRLFTTVASTLSTDPAGAISRALSNRSNTFCSASIFNWRALSTGDRSALCSLLSRIGAGAST